jgi:hypothetical protein
MKRIGRKREFPRKKGLGFCLKKKIRGGFI